MQFVEHDAYCQRVLAARFPGVSCHSDVRDFHPVPGSCDIVTGGFPCQPFSQAGKQLGEDDPRNMWPHAVRVLRESGAPLGFFENVPGLLSSGYFGTVLGDLVEAGFNAEWYVLGADDAGAPHRRKRLWIVAYAQGQPQRPGLREDEPGGQRRGRLGDTGSPWWCDPADVADPEQGVCGRRPDESGRGPEGRATAGGASAGGEQDDWFLGPYVGRVAHGVASRVDRLRALGNGQVPQCMAAAFTYLARQIGLYG